MRKATGRAPRTHDDAAEFSVSIAQIAKAPGSRRHIHFFGELDGLEVSGSRVPVGDQIEVDVVLESVSGGILVTGTVKTRYEGICRRCLEPAGHELLLHLQELCTENPTDEETYPLGHDLLDLAPMVHDACILSLPLAPLCDEGCQGICSVCGANRNFEQCRCEVERDPRWSALNLLYGGGTTGREDDTPVTNE